MPMSKLTLSADRELIKEAKELAASEGTSVSALFSRLVRAMVSARLSREFVGPLTRQASGMVRLPGAASDERLVEDGLARKYAVRK
jgi:hypothetical protein